MQGNERRKKSRSPPPPSSLYDDDDDDENNNESGEYSSNDQKRKGRSQPLNMTKSTTNEYDDPVSSARKHLQSDDDDDEEDPFDDIESSRGRRSRTTSPTNRSSNYKPPSPIRNDKEDEQQSPSRQPQSILHSSKVRTDYHHDVDAVELSRNMTSGEGGGGSNHSRSHRSGGSSRRRNHHHHHHHKHSHRGDDNRSKSRISKSSSGRQSNSSSKRSKKSRRSAPANHHPMVPMSSFDYRSLNSRSSRNHQHHHPPQEEDIEPSPSADVYTLNTTILQKDHPTSAMIAATDTEYYFVKQKYGYLSILLSMIQLSILAIMMAMCGIAPLDVNPMIGPYPDAMSEWGGKNSYLMVSQYQYWRGVSSSLLHVGVIHLLCNVAVILETCAFFEREWGSTKWALIYICSSCGAVLAGACTDPDSVSVGSSGSIMGLFGAKIAEVLVLVLFDTKRRGGGADVGAGDAVRVEQLSGVLCSVAIVSLFSFIPYVDWSGMMAGLATGFAVGTVIFGCGIVACCSMMVWTFLGLVMFLGGLGYGGYYLVTDVELNEELGDACNYFRRLYVEGYDCACIFQ